MFWFFGGSFGFLHFVPSANVICSGTHCGSPVPSGNVLAGMPYLCLISALGENVPTSLASALRMPLAMRPNWTSFITLFVTFIQSTAICEFVVVTGGE